MPEGRKHRICSAGDLSSQMKLGDVDFVLSLLLAPSLLDGLADAVLAARTAGRNTSLIIAITQGQLTALGQWLTQRGNQHKLAGIPLMLAANAESVLRQLPPRLIPAVEAHPNPIPLPTP